MVTKMGSPPLPSEGQKSCGAHSALRALGVSRGGLTFGWSPRKKNLANTLYIYRGRKISPYQENQREALPFTP